MERSKNGEFEVEMEGIRTRLSKPEMCGVNYTVEAYEGLITWTPVPDRVGSAQLNSDGTQTATFRDRLPIASHTQRFPRIRVARQQP